MPAFLCGKKLNLFFYEKMEIDLVCLRIISFIDDVRDLNRLYQTSRRMQKMIKIYFCDFATYDEINKLVNNINEITNDRVSPAEISELNRHRTMAMRIGFYDIDFEETATHWRPSSTMFLRDIEKYANLRKMFIVRFCEIWQEDIDLDSEFRRTICVIPQGKKIITGREVNWFKLVQILFISRNPEVRHLIKKYFWQNVQYLIWRKIAAEIDVLIVERMLIYARQLRFPKTDTISKMKVIYDAAQKQYPGDETRRICWSDMQFLDHNV